MKQRAMKHRAWIATLSFVFLVILVGALVLSGTFSTKDSLAQGYQFTTVRRGSLESVVTSSGSLSAVSSVSVLAQMSGRVEMVLVDYNDEVRAGQVLATINTDLLRLQAKVAEANVDKARANYDLQALAVQNARSLYEKRLVSEYELKTAEAALSVRRAELASAETSLQEIQTEIQKYAIISSPIDGMVLARHIDEGQSVVGGSTGASSLFTIVGDLSTMRIEASVDELDIASIEVGQAVRFTVSAEPSSVYQGRVSQVRLVPSTQGNIVYYSVIALADNPEGRLLPGMTANVEFIKERKEGVLVVPSAAFRFTPTTLSEAELQRALFAAGLSGLSSSERSEALARYDERQKAASGASGAQASSANGLSTLIGGGTQGPGGAPPGMPGGEPGRRSSAGGSSMPGASATGSRTQASAGATVVKKALWYLDESGSLAARLVEIGASDESRTEIIGAEDLEGRDVILKVQVR